MYLKKSNTKAENIEMQIKSWAISKNYFVFNDISESEDSTEEFKQKFLKLFISE